MKILLLTLEYPPQKGGVAAYYEGLVEELKRRGHQVEVVERGLLWRWIWPRWLRGYFTVRAATNAQKTYLLFAGHLLPLGTIAYLLRKRVPYVVFTHGMDVLIAQKSWRKRWLARKILGHAKFVVVNSEFTKAQIKKLEIRNLKLEIIIMYPCPNLPQAVKLEEVELLRQKLGLTGKKVLLTLGRVVERKGHDTVLRALPEILTHVPNVMYVVAGDGSDLGRLQKLVDVELQPYVRFMGAISDEERPLYYALCDIFVMPSRQIGSDVEGFGLAFLEAALFGKPSIGGQSGGVPEAILDGQTGVLVDSADADALARAVVQLLRDDVLREEFGQNAKARVLQTFMWSTQIAPLSNMLENDYAA